MPIIGFCVFLVSGNGTLGDTTVDARQRVDYVGIATDFSLPQEHLGEYWLLEDQSVSQRASDIYVKHAGFSTATETWSGVDQPSEDIYLTLSPQNVTLTYLQPSYADPTSPPQRMDWLLVTYSENGWGEYDQLGPFNKELAVHTDHYLLQGRDVCKTGSDCGITLSQFSNDSLAATPNITAGWGIGDIQVATDPRNLTPPSASAPIGIVNDSGMFLTQEGAPAENEGDVQTKSIQGAVPEDEPPGAHRQSIPGPSDSPTKPLHLQSQPPIPPPPDRTLPFLITVAAATGALLAALGLALYSRFNNRDEALRSETRNRLLALVRDQPGVCMSDAAERLGVARNTVRYHVRVLERVQLIRVVQEGSLVTFYPGGPVASAKVPAWLRRNEACLAILRAARERPDGLSREEVRALLPDVPTRTRNYHLSRLLGAGALVEADAPDGRKVLRPAEGWGGEASGAGSASGAGGA